MPRFTPYYFQVDPNRYFYPASTVKMPVAMMALQKLIVHHLEVVMNPDENAHTNPVTFLGPAGDTLYHQPMQVSALPPLPRQDLLGKGQEKNGQLIWKPFDFSGKNRVSLEDLTEMLKAILFPQSVSPEHRFHIDADDYRFVWKYMSQYPQESAYPPYDTSYQDAYAKYLFYGAEKGPLPKSFRIFNKIGDAWGFLVYVVCFADFERKVEFMLSATILCDRDGIFNNDQVDYETIGYPFMKQLGRVIYEYETKRPRKNVPQLDEFKLLYDK